MNISQDIKPVTYLKSRAADLLKQINETHRPVIITQNGEPKAVLQDPKSYENMRNAIGILKLISQGEDEIRSGKTVRSSIDSGYQKAFWTILDANVTTFLTALVLYEFGTGPIKGFAVTLSIGIMASMFTALVVTREIYRWAYRRRTITKLSI